jgi:hypothetical protein
LSAGVFLADVQACGRVFPDAQDVHDGDVRHIRVDSGIPGIWRRVGGHGGAELVKVSRRGEQLAAVTVAGPGSGMAVPGPVAGDQLAAAGIRKRARPSRPASGLWSSRTRPRVLTWGFYAAR